MAVRVKVKLKVEGREVTTSALANSSFETEEPEAVLPLRVAEKLSLYPKLPGGTVVEEYIGVGGFKVSTFRVPGALKVYVVCGDRVKGPIGAVAVITPGESEVILSDRVLDILGIILIRPSEGFWRFNDDPLVTVRRSVPREVW